MSGMEWIESDVVRVRSEPKRNEKIKTSWTLSNSEEEEEDAVVVFSTRVTRDQFESETRNDPPRKATPTAVSVATHAPFVGFFGFHHAEWGSTLTVHFSKISFSSSWWWSWL